MKQQILEGKEGHEEEEERGEERRERRRLGKLRRERMGDEGSRTEDGKDEEAWINLYGRRRGREIEGKTALLCATHVMSWKGEGGKPALRHCGTRSVIPSQMYLLAGGRPSSFSPLSPGGYLWKKKGE